MSKPMIVTLPFVLLLLDFWPLERWKKIPARRLLLEKAPLLALAAAASVITLLVQRTAGAVATAGEVPFALRIENALVSYLAYILQFLWPATIGRTLSLCAATARMGSDRRRRRPRRHHGACRFPSARGGLTSSQDGSGSPAFWSP